MTAMTKRETKTTTPETVRITNMQRVGVLRFCAERKDKTVGARVYDIPAGEHGDIPAEVWDRYKDRDDVKNNEGVTFCLGEADVSKMKTDTAKTQALLMKQRELEKREADLATYSQTLDEKRKEIETLRDTMHTGH